MNHAISLSNAREASIELSRRLVEREGIDIFVARLDRDRDRDGGLKPSQATLAAPPGTPSSPPGPGRAVAISQ